MDFRLKNRPSIENLIRDDKYIIDYYDIREGIFILNQKSTLLIQGNTSDLLKIIFKAL
jgi:hypothetical protein